MASCYKCNKTIVQGVDGPMPTDAVCEHCSSWLHCCANCTHYDEYSNVKCREPRADFVFDRQGKNECKYFMLRVGAKLPEEKKKFTPRKEQSNREGKAREGLANLFKA